MSKIFVAGSINMDIVAFAGKLPTKGETVLGHTLDYFPGGKGGNQAVAAARMGADVCFIGCVGNDFFARELKQFLNDMNVRALIRENPEVPTGTALITVAEGDNLITVVPGANMTLSPSDFTDIIFEPGDVLLSQFETPLVTTAAFFEAGRRAGAVTVLNPSPAAAITPVLQAVTDILIVNETELGVLAARPPVNPDPETAMKVAQEVLQRGYKAIIVTLGEKGVIAVTRKEMVQVPAHHVKVVDTTGAGDCFAGALCAALARGEGIADAVRLANCASAISVTRKGAATSSPSLEEVLGMAA